MANHNPRPNAYEQLGVHPNAPADLIASSYWLLVGELQKRRERGEYVDSALHELTRAYECVSDPKRRSEYDASIGHTLEPLALRPLSSLRHSFRGRRQHGDVLIGPLDHYEVLGISPSAPSEILLAAYQIMLNQYLRVPSRDKKRQQLLESLEDAYTTLSVPEKRQKYDEVVRPKSIEQDAEEAAATTAEPPVSNGHVVPGGIGRALTAGVRLPYRGAAAAVRGRRKSAGKSVLAERRVRPPRAPEPPIVREPAPRPRTASIDVEEALLGRIAAYVNETQPPHTPGNSAEGLDGPHAPQK